MTSREPGPSRGRMTVYLHPSAEAIALEEPLAPGQRVCWLVRRPEDVFEGHVDDVLAGLGIEPTQLATGQLMIEDHDTFYLVTDDTPAWWIRGTVTSWATVPIHPVGSYVLAELDDTHLTSYLPDDQPDRQGGR